MWTAAFIAAATGVLWWLGRSWIAGFRQGGYDEAKAEEAARDLETARKQAEVMAETRSASDAEERLDDGSF
jgi:hypothetical protein